MSTDKTEQAWHALYRRAINEANGLTNYVEDRPELRSAEKRIAKIEEEARALTAAPPAQPQEPVAELLREAHGQIKHLIEDLTTAEDDGGLVRYVPKSTLMFSNLIGALHTLAPKMETALAAPPPRAVEPMTEAEAIRLFHDNHEVHRRLFCFEWFAAGIIAAERAHGINGGEHG